MHIKPYFIFEEILKMSLDTSLIVKGFSYQLGCEIASGAVKVAIALAPLAIKTIFGGARMASNGVGAMLTWAGRIGGSEETPIEFLATPEVAVEMMRDLGADGTVIKMSLRDQRDQRCLETMKREKARIQEEMGKAPFQMEMVNVNTITCFV